MLKIPFELFVWVTGLLWISLVPPANFSICIFHCLGFAYCPGCGLGHAIYYFAHGEWEQSFKSNPLAIVAIIILLHRIYILCKQIQPPQIKSTQ